MGSYNHLGGANNSDKTIGPDFEGAKDWDTGPGSNYPNALSPLHPFRGSLSSSRRSESPHSCSQVLC